jgi:hypothetical protein
MTGRTRRRLRYLSASAVKLHLTLFVGGGGCLLAGWFELTRALDGREVAWVYAFEWPFFALIGGVLWWRLLHAPCADAKFEPSSAPLLEPSAGSEPVSEAAPDRGLLAWQDYLARLYAADPPGSPPTR